MTLWLVLLLLPFASAQTEPSTPEPFVDPTLLEQPPLPWPEGAPYAEVQVELMLLLDESGAVEQASLSAGAEPFASLALAQAFELRFTPAYEDGQPIAVEVPFTWTFTPPPVQLRGQLLDEDGLPLATVVVFLDDKPLVIDPQGRFELRQQAEGPHLLRVDDPRFAPTTVTLLAGQTVELELRAPPLPPPPDEAIGTYVRLVPQVSSRVVTAEQIRTTPGTLGDPVRVVQNLPGVVRTPFDSGWLIIRGGDPEDAGMYIDGVQVPLVYHLGGFTSVLHPGFIDSVQYTPGTFDARYGRATSGIVDIHTRPANSGQKVLFGADLIHAGVFAQTPVGEHAGFAGAVRRSYLDKAITLVLSEEQAAIAPRFWDWQMRVDHDLAGLFWMGFSDSIEAPTGEGSETAQVTIKTNRLHGRVSLAPGSTLLTVTPVLARDERLVAYDELSDSRKTSGGALRVQWESDKSWETLGFQLGVDAERYEYTLTVNELEVGRHYASADPYASLRFGNKGPRAQVGLRLDTLALEGQALRWGLSPRVQGQVPVSERLLLVGDVGVAHKYPPIEWTAGLPGGVSLQLEESRSAGVGLRFTERAYAAELDLWGRQYEHLTVFEDDGTMGQGQGQAYGVDSLVRWTWRDLSGWFSYTYSRSLRRDEPGDGYAPYIYDQPHYGVVVLLWTLPKGWSLSGRFRAGSGYAWNQDDTEAFDILALEVVPMVADINGRLSPYHALDVKLAKQATWRQVHLEFYLDVQNAYNRRIAEPMITGIEDRDTVYGVGLPVLPVFGVQGGWVRKDES